MAFPYSPPQVIIQAQGARLLAALTTARPAVVLLGTAPEGPDTPVLIDPNSARSLFGDPTDPATNGYTLPTLMRLVRAQTPPDGTANRLAFLVCRCGVTRATVNLPHAQSTNQQWTLTFTGGPPTGGNFRLVYNDHTTADITYSMTPSTTAASIQTALTAAGVMGAGNATVVATDATHFVITAAGTLAAQLLPGIGVRTASLTPLGVMGLVTITREGAAAGVSLNMQGVGAYAGTAGNNLCVSVVTDARGKVTFLSLYDTLGLSAGPVVAQQWTLTLSAVPTGGTLTLTYNDETTADITYDPTAVTGPAATAANIQSALVLLSGIGAGNVTVAAVDASTFTITAAGTLAGKALADISADTSLLTGATITNTVVIAVVGSLTPGSGWTLLQQLDGGLTDLSTPQAIASALNGINASGNTSAVVQASIVQALTPLPDAGFYLLVGGDNGKVTAADDPTVARLLSQSLVYRADYIVAGWDAHDLEVTIMAHLNDALAQNQFRKAVLGPKQGTSYADLVAQPPVDPTSWYNSFQSARVIVVGHDAVLFPNAVTGNLQIYDGFYLAAAVAGMKASSPPEETCIGFPLAAMAAVALPPDANIVVPLNVAQKDALAKAGFLVVQPGQSGRPEIRDDLTTAPFSVNNAINPFSQWNIQTIDDAVSEVLLRAVLPFRGRPMPSVSATVAQLKQAATQAMASLGTTINGVQSIDVQINVETLVPIIDVVYITRFPFRTILIRTSYVFV